MSTAVDLLRLTNRLLPAPDLPGDADPLEYARWEYDTSDTVVRLWDRAGGRAPTRALDVGCGLGGKTHRLREHTGRGVEWTALDIDLEHLRQAGDYFGHVGEERIGRVGADAARLPFADGHFDRIVSADALEHLPAPRAALAEFRRCLDEDGRLVLLFNPWGSPRGSHLGDIVHLPWCQLFFSRETLAAAVDVLTEDRAQGAPEVEAERIRAHGRDLRHHFENHLFPTRIADLRRWLAEEGTFAIESELRIGPGPIGTPAWLQNRWCEEWMSATYAAVLRPLAAASSSRASTRATLRSSS